MIFVILKKLYVKCLDINSKIKEFFYDDLFINFIGYNVDNNDST